MGRAGRAGLGEGETSLFLCRKLVALLWGIGCSAAEYWMLYLVLCHRVEIVLLYVTVLMLGTGCCDVGYWMFSCTEYWPILLSRVLTGPLYFVICCYILTSLQMQCSAEDT